MQNSKNFYQETAYEFFCSAVVAVIIMFILPSDQTQFFEKFLIYILSQIPINFVTILCVNILNVLLILVFGIWKKTSVSFFVILNGLALGVMFSIYQMDLVKLIKLLFPHIIFETFLIIVFCSHVKLLSIAWKNHDRDAFMLSLNLILYKCLPLFFATSLLEALFHFL